MSYGSLALAVHTGSSSLLEDTLYDLEKPYATMIIDVLGQKGPIKIVLHYLKGTHKLLTKRVGGVLKIPASIPSHYEQGSLIFFAIHNLMEHIAKNNGCTDPSKEKCCNLLMERGISPKIPLEWVEQHSNYLGRDLDVLKITIQNNWKTLSIHGRLPQELSSNQSRINFEVQFASIRQKEGVIVALAKLFKRIDQFSEDKQLLFLTWIYEKIESLDEEDFNDSFIKSDNTVAALESLNNSFSKIRLNSFEYKDLQQKLDFMSCFTTDMNAHSDISFIKQLFFAIDFGQPTKVATILQEYALFSQDPAANKKLLSITLQTSDLSQYDALAFAIFKAQKYHSYQGTARQVICKQLIAAGSLEDLALSQLKKKELPFTSQMKKEIERPKFILLYRQCFSIELSSIKKRLGLIEALLYGINRVLNGDTRANFSDEEALVIMVDLIIDELAIGSASLNLRSVECQEMIRLLSSESFQEVCIEPQRIRLNSILI